MKQVLLIAILFCTVQLSAQNVGIGTATPGARLEVKNPFKSTVKISSNNFADTSQLVLSNRTTTAAGTDFLITARQEQGIYVTSASDLTANTNDSILTLLTNGNVGIGKKTPTAKLHVDGNVKLDDFNLLEFGAGLAKETNAGKIGYNAFGQSALTFTGAGSNAGNRAFYFYGEGGTTFNGPLSVTGNTNLNSQLRIAGDPGTTGEVLTSNGAAAPSWKPQAYTNNIRFGVQLEENASAVSGTSRIRLTQYNTGGANVVIGASTITVNQSGLYHFDVGFSVGIGYTAAAGPNYPQFGVWLFAGYSNSFRIVDNRMMQPASNTNTYWVGDDKGSVDVYITAPATISVYHAIGGSSVGTMTSYTGNGFLTGYLISQ